MVPPTGEEILLVLLTRGPSLPSGIAEAADRHAKSISRTTRQLRAAGLVAQTAENGPYTLTPKGYREARSLLSEKATPEAPEAA